MYKRQDGDYRVSQRAQEVRQRWGMGERAQTRLSSKCSEPVSYTHLVGVGLPDAGRCKIRVEDGVAVVYAATSDIGQG